MQKISTLDAPQAIGPYSQAIVCGNLLFTSGQIPINPATSTIECNDIEGQTEQVCKNIEAILKASNTDMSKVVKTVCFLSDINNFAKFNAVYEKHFTSKPARSCVAVKDIPKGCLVEVECIALV